MRKKELISIMKTLKDLINSLIHKITALFSNKITSIISKTCSKIYSKTCNIAYDKIYVKIDIFDRVILIIETSNHVSQRKKNSIIKITIFVLIITIQVIKSLTTSIYSILIKCS